MKSREGQFPPPELLAELLYHWMKTWPSAQFDDAAVKRLYPYITDKWRSGQTVMEIAQSACSCDDGVNVTPSPAGLRPVAKRAVLPPDGAAPGTLFGASELRDVPAIARVKLAADLAGLRAKELESKMAILNRRRSLASPAVKARLEQQLRPLLEEREQQLQAQAAALQQLSDMDATGQLPTRQRRSRRVSATTPESATAPKAVSTPLPKVPRKKQEPPPSAVAAPVVSEEANVEDDIAKMFGGE